MEKVKNIPQKSKTRAPGFGRILITHTDLDGITCAILFAKCYPAGKIYFADYDDVEAVVEEISRKTQDQILITDLSVSPELAAVLDQRGAVALLDHHKTALHLNKYEWAKVNEDNSKCGAMMLYEMLQANHYVVEDYKDMVDRVDDYDRWIHQYSDSRDINRLLTILGRDRFIHRFLQQPSIALAETEQVLLIVENTRIKQYCEESADLAQVMADKNGYKMALVSAEQYTNEVGHYILENYPEVEYVMILDYRHFKCSLRGRGNVDLGELAKEAGGGGHRKAAGFNLNPVVGGE
jgi:oligoribonuclease NrnB/cAMP/cGMP phosphodiesterase (DHH superfamily)